MALAVETISNGVTFETKPFAVGTVYEKIIALLTSGALFPVTLMKLPMLLEKTEETKELTMPLVLFAS
jgi:hypothetical protein